MDSYPRSYEVEKPKPKKPITRRAPGRAALSGGLMSKPKDPVIAVVTYFETVDLALAQQTLAIAQAIVRRRQPRVVANKTKQSTVAKTPRPAESAAG
jgi:hypothetical protein